MKTNEIYIADVTPLKDIGLFERLYRSLPSFRQEKIDRLHRIEDKRLSLGAGVLLSSALSHHGIHDYRIATGTYGKPYLDGHTDLFFSLSHSHERVMCVLSQGEVGCDVQWMDPKLDPSLANRFFAVEEIEWIEAAKSDAERKERFFRIWTLRESVMKATGRGFSRSVGDFSLVIGEGNLLRLQSAAPKICAYALLEPYRESEYRYAVCGECNASEHVTVFHFE